MARAFFVRSGFKNPSWRRRLARFLEHIHKIKFGAGRFLPLIAFARGLRTNAPWAKNLKVCECGNSGLFPSHKINLWICSYADERYQVEFIHLRPLLRPGGPLARQILILASMCSCSAINIRLQP
jgi:hypothetical protein